MIEFAARHFPGDRPVAEDVIVQITSEGSELVLVGPGYRRSFRLSDLSIEPRLGDMPRILELPSGGRLEVADHGAVETLERSGGRRGDALHRFETARAAVLAATVGVAVLLVGIAIYGLPAMAWVGARLMPPAWDQQVGTVTMAFLDRELLAPSKLSAERQAQVVALFDEVTAYVDDRAALELRMRGGANEGSDRQLGPNALALPSGIVVITDELVELAASEDELSAVLAHEAGHVVHRHSLRSLIQAAGVTVLVGVLTGDAAGLNILVETAPAVLANAAYSRRFETAADDFSRAFLRSAGRDPHALGALLLRLEETTGSGGMGYLASHPPARKRAARTDRAP